MTRSLIVNADDFGISAGVTRGIMEAHTNGIVTSTSVMMNMPYAAEAIQLAQRDTPNLGLGLHIVMSFGKPLLASGSSLLKHSDSFAQNWDELHEQMPLFDAAQVRAEVRAQFDRFTQLAGCLPDHINSHHGVAKLSPLVGEAVLELLVEHHLPSRRYEFSKPVRQPDHYEDGFYWHTATLETVTGILRNLREGVSEMMTHPGYAEGLDEVYSTPRETELRVLTDPSLKTIIAEEGIQLINFGTLSRLG